MNYQRILIILFHSILFFQLFIITNRKLTITFDKRVKIFDQFFGLFRFPKTITFKIHYSGYKLKRFFFLEKI